MSVKGRRCKAQGKKSGLWMDGEVQIVPGRRESSSSKSLFHLWAWIKTTRTATGRFFIHSDTHLPKVSDNPWWNMSLKLRSWTRSLPQTRNESCRPPRGASFPFSLAHDGEHKTITRTQRPVEGALEGAWQRQMKNPNESGDLLTQGWHVALIETCLQLEDGLS